MKDKRYRVLTLVGFAMVSTMSCFGQWYQRPSGGSSGKPFDTWRKTAGARDIEVVSVSTHNSQIDELAIVYRAPDGSLTHDCAGNCNPTPSAETFKGGLGFKLAPEEYIVGISGRYGDHIHSLIVYTNKRNLPLLGGSGGPIDFGYTAPHGQMIVGFIGRMGATLNAIGVVYAPCLPTKTPCN